ncbi:MAG: hypothetical protein ACLFWD_06645, partial [Anaerolineales bacterium]
KKLLGGLPALPELYERARPGAPPSGGYRLEKLAEALPGWIQQVERGKPFYQPTGPKRVFILGYLQWWVENTAALSLLLTRAGHQVTLAHLPYRHWWNPRSQWDVRRQRAYLNKLLGTLDSLVEVEDLLAAKPESLPPELEESLDYQSLLDVQYTLQREDIDPASEGEAGQLFRLRLARNQAAAARALSLLQGGDFDAVILPNGSILEFGALYRTAQHLGLPVTTYDFGEQRDRLWLAQDQEVMRLNTDELWRARGSIPLTGQEERELEQLYRARRGGQVWETFARQWQSGESLGAQKLRAELGLDPGKPLVLLCTNVVGDSLALDRQVFTEGMADWVERTVQHLADKPGVQLVVRVHPGELLGAGHPSVEIVNNAMEDLPDHVLVIPPDSEINTYDLIELAHLGLVYTTTVGLEMALMGVPVIVAGEAHYRDKGFTYHPESMKEYLETLDQLLADPKGRRLPESQVQLARRYAYRFFFEYPFAYPWHVIHFWKDLEERPFEAMMDLDGLDPYLETLEALVGQKIDWGRRGTVMPTGELSV